ncbi:MAG: phospholipase D-like domain-containing protein [bacterium]|nr:phospholipase D-like domain-containing protein [bacterium]
MLPILFLLLYSSPVAASLSLTGKLNINSATIQELLLLPYIGEVRSEAIYSHRERRGEFKKLSSLLDVKGIGAKTYNQILPYIKLNGDSDLAIKNDASLLDVGLEPGYIENARGEVMLLGNSDFFDILLDSINKARKSISVSMFVFKTSQYSSNRANIIMDALGRAAEKGLSVSLVMEKGGRESDSVTLDNKKTAQILAKKGVKVRFDIPEKRTHTKTIVIDERYVFIGSHNFTHSALKYNNELSVMIDSATLAGAVLSYISNIK